MGPGRAEEEERTEQSTESGCNFTVSGGKRRLSTGRLGAVEAQGRCLPQRDRGLELVPRLGSYQNRPCLHPCGVTSEDGYQLARARGPAAGAVAAG